jgi:hypothetical protein
MNEGPTQRAGLAVGSKCGASAAVHHDRIVDEEKAKIKRLVVDGD